MQDSTPEAEKPIKVPLSISTDPDIKEWVTRKAAEDERSISIYVSRLLRAVKDNNDSS